MTQTLRTSSEIAHHHINEHTPAFNNLEDAQRPLSLEKPKRLSLAELDAAGDDDPELAITTFDKYAVHKCLMKDIDALTEWKKNGLNLSEQREEDIRIEKLRSELVINSIDLAAQFLSKDLLEAYDVQPIILDNAAIHHPPKLKEVLLLATAASVTRNAVVQALFEASIDEIADEAEKEYLKHILSDSHEQKQPFMITYVKTEYKRLDEEDFDIDRIERPNAYMAFGRCVPVQDAMKDAFFEYSSSQDVLSEENEQLVEHVVAVPDHFLSGNDTYSTKGLSGSCNKPSSYDLLPSIIKTPERAFL
jgi:hypothetical protein